MEHTGFIKKQVAMDLGVVIPDIYFTDNLNLEPDMYVIKIKDAEITTGELVLNSLLAVGPQDSLNLLKGIRYIDNTYGVSLWITQDHRKKQRI
jgi:flagellar biosynthesis protein FlhA